MRPTRDELVKQLVQLGLRRAEAGLAGPIVLFLGKVPLQPMFDQLRADRDKMRC